MELIWDIVNLIKSDIEILDMFNQFNLKLKNVFCKVNYPAANNSALDGFAIKSLDSKYASKRKEIKFKVLRVLAAGDKPKIKYKKCSCVEIMTGAIIPKPFDTVIPIELVNFYPNRKNPQFILINRKIKNNHCKYHCQIVKITYQIN